MWCRFTDSNRGPTDYKSVALPTELKRRHIVILHYKPALVYLLNAHRSTHTHGNNDPG